MGRKIQTPNKRVKFLETSGEFATMHYRGAMDRLDKAHKYNIFWVAEGDLDGINSGGIEGVPLTRALEMIEDHSRFGDHLFIKPRTLRLASTRYKGNVGVINTDERRTIYDPEKILEGLEDLVDMWYAHNIIRISDPNSVLGKHHHNYTEAFFVPYGIFQFALADPEEPRRVFLQEIFSGGRIVIPEGIDHTVKGKMGSVLMGYGSAPFDSANLIDAEDEVTNALLAAME